MNTAREILLKISRWKKLTGVQKNAVNTAIRLVDYAIPMKARHAEDGWYCGRCEGKIVNSNYEYCPWCGQTVECKEEQA